MKRIYSKLSGSAALVLAVLTAGFLLSVDGAGAQPSKDLQDELREMIGTARDQVYPALVSIHVVTVQHRQGRELKGSSVGSGTIISAEGHVLTNQHVVQDGRKFVCTLSDKRELTARLVGEDPLTDLALLILEDPEERPLPVAALGDSDGLEVGDYVMAMGSPFSLSRSVSLGIVANTERVFAAGFGSDDIGEMELERGQRTGLFTRWIQHDALINPGNSGGPLVNLRGEIVGINELGGSAMGFAIPSNLAKRVFLALREHGEVPRSWIGASFRTIRRSGHEEGVLISSVVAGSPAAKAGIKAGDLLLKLSGEPVTVRFPEEVPPLMDRVASLEIGSTLGVEIQRGEERIQATMTTEKLEKDLGYEVALPAWGMTAQEITRKMARDWNLESTEGALITGLRSGGPGQVAEPPLSRGDVVVGLDGDDVSSLDDLIAFYEASRQGAPDDGPEDVLFRLRRRGTEQLTLLTPRQDEEDDPPRELPKPWIGVATQLLSPRLAEHLVLSGVEGFRITRVYPESEASLAGLQVGDVVVALDGEALKPGTSGDTGLLGRLIRGRQIGETVDLAVVRGSERLALPVVLERTRMTPEQARRHRDSDFEITVRELTFFDRDENGWEEGVEGVLVENVEPGGWAGLGGVRPRDVLLTIDDEPTASLRAFRQVLRRIKEQQPERVVVVLRRGAKVQIQHLEPDWTPTTGDALR